MITALIASYLGTTLFCTFLFVCASIVGSRADKQAEAVTPFLYGDLFGDYGDGSPEFDKLVYMTTPTTHHHYLHITATGK